MLLCWSRARLAPAAGEGSGQGGAGRDCSRQLLDVPELWLQAGQENRAVVAVGGQNTNHLNSHKPPELLSPAALQMGAERIQTERSAATCQDLLPRKRML